MPRTKRNNLLSLAVLSLLHESPKHPYEIGVVMKQRGLSDTIKLNTGSLYAVIDQLIKSRLIEPVETVKEGKHPERTIYRPTTSGRDEFFDWLRSLLRAPAKEYLQFAAGLSFLGHLAPLEACDLLKERKIALKNRVDETRSTMDATLKSGVHPMFVIETDYELALMEAELNWIDRLVADIEEGPFAERSGERTIWSVKFEENDE